MGAELGKAVTGSQRKFCVGAACHRVGKPSTFCQGAQAAVEETYTFWGQRWGQAGGERGEKKTEVTMEEVKGQEARQKRDPGGLQDGPCWIHE